MPVDARRLSPDTWAVLLALLFAALIHFHVLHSIAW